MKPTLLLIFLSAVCAAQITSNGTFTTAQGLIISGGGGNGTLTCNGINGCSGLTARDSDTLYGVPTESRKDDGRGPTIQQVKLSAKNWDNLTLAPAGYIARAQRINLESAGTDEAQMLKAIHDAHLHVYDFTKVDNYLYRKALKQGANVRWVWEPMREKDVKSSSEQAGEHRGSGYIYAKQYAHEVPDRVLADVERLLDCAPEDTVILVSDYKAVNPDPFLAVSTPKMLAAGKVLIVDQWNEPGFDDGEPVIEPARTIAMR